MKARVLVITVLILFGVLWIVLGLVIPIYFELLRGIGSGVVFTPGYESLQEALNRLFATFSILTAVSFAFLVLPFSNDKTTPRKPTTLILAVITLILFVVGTIWSLVISLGIPLAGKPLTSWDVYSVISFLLLSLAFMFFTIASNIYDNAPKLTSDMD